MNFSKYFFRNTSEYFNFKIFGWQHITILFIGILGIISIIKRIAVNRKFERIVGIVLLSQQTILYTWYLLSGYNLLIEGLPLYHCRIAIILLKETAVRLNKGIIAFSPLAQGLLTNRYLNGIPEDSRIRTDGRFLKESVITEEKLAQIRALNEIAAARGQTLAEMALAWILRDGKVTSVLIGASKPQQILDNIAALNNTTFTADELEAIDKASGFYKE